MKKILIIAIILLSGCTEFIYNDSMVIQEIHNTDNGCDYLVRSFNKYDGYVEYIIKDCPCDKWSVGDTVRFE